ncbi:MAG: ABC transporter ATP-binding protein [Acidobacteriota bacterium]
MSTNYKLETSKRFGGPKPGAPAGDKGTAKPAANRTGLRAMVDRFRPLMVGETTNVVLALLAMAVSSGTALLAPVFIARAIDTHIRVRNEPGLLVAAAEVLGIYLFGIVASYTQVLTMGSVGRRVLYGLRNALFTKLQELPVAFFNQNKAGDLISRLNNDTDKLNQFVGQAMMQFLGSVFMMSGTAIFLISMDIRLGLAALLPAVVAFGITKLTAGWLKRKNLKSLQSLGGMSSEIQESLGNFKVIVAFNRKDYFRRKFDAANQANYSASVSAGFANNILMPLYGLASHAAQLVVVAYGIWLIDAGQATLGLLIAFLLYVTTFYGPLRQLAMVWSSFQLAVAAMDRISEVMALESDMPLQATVASDSDAVLSFRNVRFRYPDSKDILHTVNLELERGKAYALVGPTGGGKTTTASLMARLYDPTEGFIFLNGQDIRSIPPKERAQKVGFILQEPFLFSGTVRDNIVYGNEELQDYTSAQLEKLLEASNLSSLMARFSEGLDTPVASSGNSISLGQKQLIAFMRATLRKPDLLILDEATANIDTVTEQLLQEILDKLPKTTTKVIIAHRLNTIDNVDEIFFVNSGEVTPAGSMQHAVEMLTHGKRSS